MTDQSEPQPFNEQEALAELERLAERIQLSRRQRERAVEEFDAFVRTFRSPGGRQVAVAVASHHPVIEDLPPEVERPVPAVVSLPPSVESWQPAVDTFPPALESPSPREWPVAPPTGRKNRLAVALVGLLLVAAVILLARSWRSAPAPPPATTVHPTPASEVVPPPVSSPTAPAAPARALNVELTIIRPVWVRAVVDERRAVERELNAGEKIPLSADRSILIRADDGGAIRLTVDGRDQGTLGRDGQILTRAFTAPASAR